MEPDEQPNDHASELARLRLMIAEKEREAKTATEAVAHYRKEWHVEREVVAELPAYYYLSFCNRGWCELLSFFVQSS